jgi:L-aminopeptidase/D-esterase-like protein
MATVTLNRSDLFPIGTSVGIYPAGARQSGQVPSSAAITSGTVDAAGLLSITNAGILSYTRYVAYALVNGEHRYAALRSTLDAQTSGHTWKKVGTTWPATVAARRTASGTS